MDDPAILAKLARVATVRRDRGAAALAEAARATAAREAALAQAHAAEARAAERLAEAGALFAGDPACAQARLWRAVTATRAAEARAARDARAVARDEATDLQIQARAALVRAEAKMERAGSLHSRARLRQATTRDDREAEDRAHPTRANR